MKYETTITKRVSRKAIAKMTHDITKLSTGRILLYLVKRHQLEILTTFAALEFGFIIVR